AIALARAGATHGPFGLTNDAHVDDVFLGARQIAAQYFGFDVVQDARNTGHDIRGRVLVLFAVRRNPERDQGTQRPGAVRREVGQGGGRGATTDFLEVEPIGPEMDVLERVVDADREVRRAQRNHRAVVTELRGIARDLSDPLDDAADAIELFAGTEIHGTFFFTTPLEPQVPLELEDWRSTHPEGPPGHRLGAGCGPSIAGRLARRPDRGHARRVPRPRRGPFPGQEMR